MLNRNFHSNVNILGRFYKQFLTSLYRSTLFDIFLKPDSKQKYLQVEQRQLSSGLLALVLARKSHIKPDSEAGVLIWVEGWYHGRYGKFHVIIFLSHTGIYFAKTPLVDISSTQIRSKIRNQQDLSGLLPENIIEYIHK
jgi:hypothetical protein